MKNINKLITVYFMMLLSAFLICYMGSTSFVVTAASSKVISIKKSPYLKASKIKSTSVKLKWSKTKNVTTYSVYKSTDKKNWTRIKRTTEPQYTVKDLKANRDYYFKVRAYNSKSEKLEKSPYSNVVAIKTKRTEITSDKVPVTKNIRGTSNDTTISVSWDKVVGAAGYRVYDYYGGWQEVGETTECAFTITQLRPVYWHTISVRAYKIEGDKIVLSSEFPEFNICTTPSKVQDLRALPMKNSIHLSWESLAGEGDIPHQIYIYDKKTKKYKFLAKTMQHRYEVTGLNKGETYSFKVRAYFNSNKTYRGKFSDSVTVTTQKGSDNSLGSTESGIKLYPVTSKAAKDIVSSKFLSQSTMGIPMYEAKLKKNNKVIVYMPSRDGWWGKDIEGTRYVGTGKIEICEYCGRKMGDKKNMCYGGCAIVFH